MPMSIGYLKITQYLHLRHNIHCMLTNVCFNKKHLRNYGMLKVFAKKGKKRHLDC